MLSALRVKYAQQNLQAGLLEKHEARTWLNFSE
jgi:hypothetical protein